MPLLKRLTTALILSILFSCESDPEPNNCKPVSIRWYEGEFFDSTRYEYNTSGKLDKLLSYWNGSLAQSFQLEFNNRNELSKVTRTINGTPDYVTTGDLIYGSEGQVAQLKWSALDGTLLTTVTFTHDSKGRLSTFTGENYKVRYEYTDDDNVIKTFYTLDGGTEKLARQNNAFDNARRFYAAVPELETVSVYIFEYEPNKNNVTSAINHMPSRFLWLEPAENVSIDLTYNENGLPASSHVQSQWMIYMPDDYKLKEIKYRCD